MKNNIDYTFGQYNRSSLYFKRSTGSPIPVGFTWQCPCGQSNMLTDQQEQYCPKCGIRLRLQEQKGDPMAPVQESNGIHRYTLVRVAHFTIYSESVKP